MTKEILQALEELGGSALLGDIVTKTGIIRETVCRQLRSMYNRGEIDKTFTNMGKYRGSTIGLMTKYQFVYSLK